jgi:hypothetical protein
MDILAAILPALVVAGFAAVVVLQSRTAKRIELLSEGVSKLRGETAAILDRLTTIETDISRSRISQEAAIQENLRQVRADVKAVELQLSDGRENPAAIETAIGLVREGLDSDEIVRRTGLSAEVVESIVLFHGLR